jgi:alginate O-acetyltransferase complex protein AlgJ
MPLSDDPNGSARRQRSPSLPSRAAERLPEREVQALREAGRTDIARPAAWVLAALFLATLVVVPSLRPFSGAESGPLAPFAELASRLRRPVEDGPGPPLVAANRRLIAAMRGFEDRLEEGSWPRRRLLPPLQQLLTGRLGAGNEQAYPGRGGWLYYRPDVDHLTGPGFLDPAVLARRARGGDAWEEPPQPDPVPALVELARQVGEAGAALVVLPVPAKPAVRPEPLAGRRAPLAPLRNPSWATFRGRLEAAGIAVVDPAPALAALEGERYLRTDTHWRPEAVERTATLLAAAVEPLLAGAAGAGTREAAAAGDPDRDAVAGAAGYSRRPVLVENLGDIAVMLRLPAGQGLFAAERVEARMVLDGAGRPWRRDATAEVLLLGDSFTNVYSDPALGWGRGAGLAEQLAYELDRPVDKLALNAGGAYATRQALARALTSGRSSLDGKRVVVYQFATRELSGGDWRRVGLAAEGGDAR